MPSLELLLTFETQTKDQWGLTLLTNSLSLLSVAPRMYRMQRLSSISPWFLVIMALSYLSVSLLGSSLNSSKVFFKGWQKYLITLSSSVHSFFITLVMLAMSTFRQSYTLLTSMGIRNLCGFKISHFTPSASIPKKNWQKRPQCSIGTFLLINITQSYRISLLVIRVCYDSLTPWLFPPVKNVSRVALCLGSRQQSRSKRGFIVVRTVPVATLKMVLSSQRNISFTISWILASSSFSSARPPSISLLRASTLKISWRRSNVQGASMSLTIQLLFCLMKMMLLSLLQCYLKVEYSLLSYYCRGTLILSTFGGSADTLGYGFSSFLTLWLRKAMQLTSSILKISCSLSFTVPTNLVLKGLQPSSPNSLITEAIYSMGFASRLQKSQQFCVANMFYSTSHSSVFLVCSKRSLYSDSMQLSPTESILKKFSQMVMLQLQRMSILQSSMPSFRQYPSLSENWLSGIVSRFSSTIWIMNVKNFSRSFLTTASYPSLSSVTILSAKFLKTLDSIYSNQFSFSTQVSSFSFSLLSQALPKSALFSSCSVTHLYPATLTHWQMWSKTQSLDFTYSCSQQRHCIIREFCESTLQRWMRLSVRSFLSLFRRKSVYSDTTSLHSVTVRRDSNSSRTGSIW